MSVATLSYRTACQASLSSYTHAPLRRNSDIPNLTSVTRYIPSNLIDVPIHSVNQCEPIDRLKASLDDIANVYANLAHIR